MLKEFKNPGNQYRPIPFWSWNDRLEQEEIRYQIEEMKKGGMGGYFMHARSGLKTGYLSKEWFDCIKTGIESAKEQGMNAWIYDEEGWPSGFAGGLVPAMSVDYQAKFMTMERYGKPGEIPNRDELIACFLLWKNGRGEVTGYQRVNFDSNQKENSSQNESTDKKVLYDKEEDSCEILVFRKHINPFYVDTMNKRAIEAFLHCTHEVYYEKFKEAFGKQMLGFFTDEPRLTCNNFGDLAWSDDLPGEFEREYGYEIIDHLPALYLKTPHFERFRYDFWETVSRMFVQNYMKTIYDWCEDHNCKATGHIMMEESIFSQMTSTAGVMPFYEYLHVPGIDWLRRMISSPVIGKQVGSVACQLGKKQILTESYALCGWDVNFEELKWIAQWQFVNGVNQICQHLMAYTIRGVRKRDYPPSHFTQQSWWKEARLFNDYLSRLCVALSEGDQTADVLLLHPMKSGYLAFDGTRTEEIKMLDDDFTKASECLSGEHISYHFGDETIIGKYGITKGDCFQVGRVTYQTVILPSMLALDRQTLALLLSFAQNGGTILSLGVFPAFTNGKKEDLALLLQKVVPMEYEQVRNSLEKKKLLTFSVREKGEQVSDIHYLSRKTEEAELYYLVNLSQEARHEVTVDIIGKKGRVLCLDAMSGEEEELPVLEEEDCTRLSLSFEPMQSYLLLFEEGRESCVTEKKNTVIYAELGEQFKIRSMTANSMTLDQCRYRIDGGEWQEEIPVIHLQSALMELRRPCNAELLFRFELESDPSSMKELMAAIEDADRYTITVNGKTLTEKSSGWWKDKSFRTVDLLPYVKRGNNEICLAISFFQPQKVYDVLFGENVYETEKNKITYETELESIYLVGDFGVWSKTDFVKSDRRAVITQGPFLLTEAPKQLNRQCFEQQGLLFFAGELELEQELVLHKEEGRQILLKLTDQRAPLVKVFVNGIHVKDSLWAPYEADITEAVKEGSNTVTLQVFASNRNLLGPHHHRDGECYHVGPESFTGKWSWVERKSEADATDIADREKNYWTESYCFVEMGI